jgi:hypothetical protein
VSSIALYVVETTSVCGFDSFRAHQLSLQARDLSRTLALSSCSGVAGSKSFGSKSLPSNFLLAT